MKQEGIAITNDVELHQRIMKLNYLKAEQEDAIKRNVSEIMYSIHPSMIVKNFVEKFIVDPEATRDLKHIGLNLGKDFLINKIFGRKGSLKGFLSSLLVRKATDYIVKNHSETISTGMEKIGNYLKDLGTKTNHKVQTN